MGGGVKEGEETTKKERERTASLPAHVDIWSGFFPSRRETRRLFFVLFKVKTAIASGSGHRREPQVF